MCQKCKNDECGGCQRVVITKQGERGFPGAPGLKGDNGNIGAQGAKGDKGDQGDQGIQGDAGVDAAAIYDSIYLGWIEQFSTAGPAMTIPTNGNTLGAVVWTRNSVGHYIGTLAGAFTSKIVVCSLVQSSFALPNSCFLQIGRFNNDTIVIRTFNSSGVLADGILNNASLKIEVFSI